MGRLILLLIFCSCIELVFGQAGQVTKPLKYQTSGQLLITGTSNPFKYSTHASPVLTAYSNKLFFTSNSEKAIAPETKAKETKDVKTELPKAEVAVVAASEKKNESPPAINESSREVTAQNKSVTTIPKPVIISKALGEEYVKVPKYHALIMGVSGYKYNGAGISSLENPVKDAQKLYDILTTKYSFDPQFVTLLKDPNRQQVIDAFERLSTEITQKDNILIFYAGHGYFDKQKGFGYWLPSDARITSRSDWIANSTIKDYLGSIKSKHTLLITDACFGGSIFKQRAIDPSMAFKVSDLYKDPSRKALTSGNLSEVPDQSMFLEQLLKKLTENSDDFLPAQKLWTRIYEPITNNSIATPQFGVIQGVGDEGGDFIFIRKNVKQE